MRGALGLVLLVVMAGCLTGPEAPDVPYPDHLAHEIPERVEGRVEVEPAGDQWKAKQEILWSNGYGDATTGSVNVSSGSIAVGSLDAGVYVIRTNAWAMGDTEEDARTRLAAIEFTLEDTLQNGTVSIAHSWTGPDQAGVSTIVAVPRLPHTIQARSDGVVLVRDTGPVVTLEGRTVILEGAYDEVGVTAQAAKLDLGRAGTGPGSFLVQGGSIQMTLAPGAYDLSADGDSLQVEFEGEPIGEQTSRHAHLRSPRFASADAPTTVVLTGESIRVSP